MPAIDTPNLALKHKWNFRESGWNGQMDANLVKLGALLQASVLDKDLTAPPGGPSVGDRYLIAGAATGAWAGHEQSLTVWDGAAWQFYAPAEGWLCWVSDEHKLYAYSGAAWAAHDPAAGAYLPLAGGTLSGPLAINDTLTVFPQASGRTGGLIRPCGANNKDLILGILSSVGADSSIFYFSTRVGSTAFKVDTNLATVTAFGFPAVGGAVFPLVVAGNTAADNTAVGLYFNQRGDLEPSYRKCGLVFDGINDGGLGFGRGDFKILMNSAASSANAALSDVVFTVRNNGNVELEKDLLVKGNSQLGDGPSDVVDLQGTVKGSPRAVQFAFDGPNAAGEYASFNGFPCSAGRGYVAPAAGSLKQISGHYSSGSGNSGPQLYVRKNGVGVASLQLTGTQSDATFHASAGRGDFDFAAGDVLSVFIDHEVTELSAVLEIYLNGKSANALNDETGGGA